MHAEEDAAVHGLEAVADVGKGASDDDGHGVGEVGLFGLGAELEVDDALAGGVHVGVAAAREDARAADAIAAAGRGHAARRWHGSDARRDGERRPSGRTSRRRGRRRRRANRARVGPSAPAPTGAPRPVSAGPRTRERRRVAQRREARPSCSSSRSLCPMLASTTSVQHHLARSPTRSGAGREGRARDPLGPRRGALVAEPRRHVFPFAAASRARPSPGRCSWIWRGASTRRRAAASHAASLASRVPFSTPRARGDARARARRHASRRRVPDEKKHLSQLRSHAPLLFVASVGADLATPTLATQTREYAKGRIRGRRGAVRAAPPPADDPWEEVRDESTGQTYWWNVQTNETTALGAPKPQPGAPPPAGVHQGSNAVGGLEEIIGWRR